MPSLSFTVVDTGVLVGGKTFNVKDRLKEVGGRWNPQLSSWSVPAAADTPELRDELETLATQKKAEEAAANKAARLYAASAEGKAAAAAEEKRRIKAAVAAGSSWICCNDCQVIDWVRQHTSCQVCAVDGNSFRVRGNIRTGD
jgi:hypothetical protein